MRPGVEVEERDREHDAGPRSRRARTGTGCFITRCAWRPQNPSADGGFDLEDRAATPPAGRAPRGSPAGRSTDEIAARNTTATPAYANERRYVTGKSSSAASEIITVPALNTTVRPAVCIVRPTATLVDAPVASSSRYRETTNRL